MQIKVIDKLSNLIILNLLYIASLISIVAFPAAESALISTLIKIVRHDESYPSRDFKKNFFQDYWKNTAVQLISVLPILILLSSFVILPYTTLPIYLISVLRHIGIIFLILYLIATAFLTPLNARYKNTIKNSIHNSIILAHRHFFIAVLIRIIDTIPFLIFFLLQGQLLVWITLIIFILPASTKYLNAFLFNYVFSQYEKLN